MFHEVLCHSLVLSLTAAVIHFKASLKGRQTKLKTNLTGYILHDYYIKFTAFVALIQSS